MPVFALSLHREYRCRHSGACCTAGWAIPVSGRLLPLLGTDLLVPDADGACRYYDAPARLCRIHAAHGESMLPMSCYQFPRRALIDERGTLVALSHFCPTAATLLCEDEAPLDVIEAPPAFPESHVYEGLDARGAWAPLVRPGVLFDLASYSRWERFAVAAFAPERPVMAALAELAAAAERLRAWAPDDGPFDAWVFTALSAPLDGADAIEIYDRFATRDAYDTLHTLVPEGLAAPPPADPALPPLADADWGAEQRSARRYLASRAFASWAAYEGHGLRTLIAELVVSALVLHVECRRACHAAGRALDRPLMIESIRQSDLLLVHLIDRPRLVEWLGQIEDRPPSP